MAEISAGLVKELREKTNVGFMDCKKALEVSAGDIEKAIEYLRKQGQAVAQKKASRTANDGLVSSYIHLGGKIGVLVEVNCETDFVAKNEQFAAFVKDIAMQIAAAKPLYVSRDEVPADIVSKEKEIYAEQIKDKPAQVIEKIVQGKLDKYFAEVCLLEQAFIKDQNIKIKDLLTAKIQSIGENIIIRRFVRYEVGS